MLTLREYLQLTKPRVVALLVFCAVIGMFLAVPGIPPWRALVFGTLGIWMASGSAAAFNHLIDERIDKLMARTARRPLATGSLTPRQVLVFAVLLGIASMLVLALLVNTLTAVLTFGGLIGYALVYTAYLKRATPQNIVIGGLAGAIPPVLGWTAVTGQLHPFALQLCLIIFVWTPPHFWALAIFRRDDYARAQVPMLPVTHGVVYTRWQVLFYTDPAGAGDPAAGAHRHERPDLPRRRDGAGCGFPLLRRAADESAGRAVPDEGVQVLDRVPDGAVRVPAGRPLAGRPMVQQSLLLRQVV